MQIFRRQATATRTAVTKRDRAAIALAAAEKAEKEADELAAAAALLKAQVDAMAAASCSAVPNPPLPPESVTVMLPDDLRDAELEGRLEEEEEADEICEAMVALQDLTLEDLEGLGDDPFEEAMDEIIEEASSRAIWAELGLPFKDYPLPPLLDDVPPEAVSTLTSSVFGIDSFAVSSIESTQCGVLFRGNLRRDAAVVSATVQARLRQAPELASKLRLFLLSDPGRAEVSDAAEGLDGSYDLDLEDPLALEPVFLALPAEMRPDAATGSRRTWLAPAATTVLTAGVTILWAAHVYAGTPAIGADNSLDLEVAGPLITAVLGLQGIHEIGHLFGAARHGLQVQPFLLLPSTTLGCAGGHAPLASFPENRTALFDFAIAGPLCGLVASACFLGAGLLLTAVAPETVAASFPHLPMPTLHCSLLGSLAVEAALGTPDPTMDQTMVVLHPYALAGFAGLVSNALSLVPIGRLDGGRAATAVFGRRPGAALGGLTCFGLGFICIFSDQPELLSFWAFTSILLFRQAEVPCVDEVSEPSPACGRLLTVLFGLVFLVLCPAPGSGPDSFAFLAEEALRSL